MAKITFKGTPVNTSGNLPLKGSIAPNFTLVKTDLGELSLSELKGKTVVLSISPSFDTSICATSVRKFNEYVAGKPGHVVLAITKDLPFAHSRFCTAEGITSVIPLSGFRNSEFGQDYGVEFLDGPFKGLYSRSIVIVDPTGKVKYTQQVPETAQDPDYDAVFAAL
jgi:thioredoxin-dependent peroxiredoxin